MLSSSGEGIARILRDSQIRGKVSSRFPEASFVAGTGTPPGVSSAFVWRLIRACRHGGGVGLHGSQVGVFQDVFVMTLDEGKTWHACLNPEWVPVPQQEGAAPSKVPGVEGCLSVPGAKGIKVMRYPVIRASWHTSDMSTRETHVLAGLAAVVFQHETDHGRGRLISGR